MTGNSQRIRKLKNIWGIIVSVYRTNVWDRIFSFSSLQDMWRWT